MKKYNFKMVFDFPFRIVKVGFFLIGTLLNITAFGQVNNALNFNGTSDYINCGANSSLNITSSLTLEMWIKPSRDLGQNRYDRLIHKNYGSSYYFGGIGGETNAIGALLSGSFVAKTPVNSITVGQWQHVAFVFDDDANSTKIYINGIEKASLPYTGTIIGNTVPLTISDDGNEKFAGDVDEVRIWNRARSQAEILSTMNYQLLGNENGLVLYYNFNVGTPSGNNTTINTVSDISGNLNTGTLSGFVKTASTSNFVTSTNGVSIPTTSVTISSNASNNTICNGSNITLTAIPVYATNPTYKWTKNGVEISGATSATYTNNAIVNNDVISVVMMVSGTNYSSNNLTILVNQSNTISLASATGSNLQSVCGNIAISSITYSTTGATGASVTGLPSGISGVWFNNLFTISGLSALSGNYIYSVTSTGGGCGGVVPTGNISILPLPNIAASLTGDACSNKSTLSATNGFNSYRWLKDNVGIVNATTVTYKPTVKGDYKVQVSDGACSNTSLPISIYVCSASATGKMVPTNSAILVSREGGAFFKTGVSYDGEKLQITPKISSTTTATNITSTSAISGGVVSSDGGDNIITRGVVWSTIINPTISLTTKTLDGSGTGIFTSNIIGLTPSTKYYFRAYATNNEGTTYGTESSFTTL